MSIYSIFSEITALYYYVTIPCMLQVTDKALAE